MTADDFIDVEYADMSESKQEEVRIFATVEQILSINGVLSVAAIYDRLPSSLKEIKDQESSEIEIKDHRFPSIDSLREYIVRRPHFFRLSPIDDTVSVHVKEQRQLFMSVVRHIRSCGGSTSFQSIIDLLIGKDKRWKTSAVYYSMLHGDNTFEMKNDTVYLRVKLMEMDCFFSSIYFDYPKILLDKTIDMMPKDEDGKEHAQLQCAATQLSFPAIVMEVKANFFKSTVLCGPFERESVYCLPRQIKDSTAGTTNVVIGQNIDAVVHDVEGGACRFRMDDFWLIDKQLLTQFDNRLGMGFEPKETAQRVIEKKKTRAKAESTIAPSKKTIESVDLLTERLPRSEYWSYSVPPNRYLDTIAGQAEAERARICLLDDLILAGLKWINDSKKNDDAEKEYRYPLGKLSVDINVRKMIRPNERLIVDDDETVEDVLRRRPHLYNVEELDGKMCVSLRPQRELIDNLLRFIDREIVWYEADLKAALGNGEAGEEWRDCDFGADMDALYPLVSVERGGYIKLCAARQPTGEWIEAPAPSVRGW